MKLSIRKKTVIMIIAFAFALITIATWMYARVIVNNTSRQYSERADELSATAALILEPERVARLHAEVFRIYDSVPEKVLSDRWGEDDWNSYVANFSEIEQNEDFIELRKKLREIQDRNTVECVYISAVDVKNEVMLYLVDGAYEDACPPGCIDELYDINRGLLEDPARGFPAYITDTEEYGKLVTAGAPIRRGEEIVAYAMVDFSLEALHGEQARSVWKLYGYLVVAAIVICIISICIVKNILVKPVKALTEASRRFASSKNDPDCHAFADVKIKTGDEIEELAESMRNMEIEINGNIKELVQMNERLAASQNVASEMTKLANKDALTGVRNKTSYDRAAEKLDERIHSERFLSFGVVMIDLNSLKVINDTYGHSSGDAAIIRLSGIVCESFRNSPVYRIGGDEFVAILKDGEQKRAQELIDGFNENVRKNAADASLPPEERVSAAVGYSAYDPQTDKCFADVFKRADEAMYENKRITKSNKS